MNNKFTYYLPFIGLLIFYLFKSLQFSLHDFSNAYFSAYFLSAGAFDHTIYDALKFNQMIVDAGFPVHFVAYYPNTPFLAFFFLPLSFVANPEWSKLLFNILSCSLLLVSLIRLNKYFGHPSPLIIFIPILFFIPIKNHILFGQLYFLLFFLLAEGLIAFKKEQHFLGGFYWSWAILLKVFPVILAIFLMAKRKYKSLVFLLASSIGILLLSFLKLDLSDWWFYLSEVFPKSIAGEIDNGFAPGKKSVTMLLKNIFVYDQVLNPHPLIPSYLGYNICQSFFKAIILAFCTQFTLLKEQSIFSCFAIWIIATTLLSPGLSSYAGILLLFPLLVVWQPELKIGLKHKILFSLLTGLYGNIPISWFLELPLLLKFPKVYILIFIFFSYWMLVKSNRLSSKNLFLFIIGFFIVFFLPSLFKEQPKQNNYVIEKEEHILIADYFIKDEILHYQFWALPQPKTIPTNIKVTSSDTLSVKIVNNQLYYYNKQLTFDKSNKLKPSLINRNTVVYLSDQNRGTGFYTLLKIEVDK